MDAPCGSERHLVQQEEEKAGEDSPVTAASSSGGKKNGSQGQRRGKKGKEEAAGLGEWSPGRTKHLTNDQRALLSSALRCVLPLS